MGEDPTHGGCNDLLYGAVRYIYPSSAKKKKKLHHCTLAKQKLDLKLLLASNLQKQKPRLSFNFYSIRTVSLYEVSP